MRLPCAALVLFAAAGCTTGTVCNTVTDDVSDVCLPATIAPGIPLRIDVREACGPGCSGPPGCSAIFQNGAVILGMEQDICSDNFSQTCLAQGCQQRTISCQLPPLNAGDYALLVPGGPPRLLRVQPGGSSTCHFFPSGGRVQQTQNSW